MKHLPGAKPLAGLKRRGRPTPIDLHQDEVDVDLPLIREIVGTILVCRNGSRNTLQFRDADLQLAGCVRQRAARE